MKKKKTSAPKKFRCDCRLAGWIGVVAATAIIVGGGVYLWMNQCNSRMEYELNSEINRLNAMIRTRLATGGASPAEIVPDGAPPRDSNTVISSVTVLPDDSSGKAAVENALDGTTRFSSCGRISSFRFQSWYDGLEEAASRLNVAAGDATSSCYSPGNGLFIFLIPGAGECDTGSLYRYLTGSGELSKAWANLGQETCAPLPEVFGRRDGNEIGLSNRTTIRDCAMSYDFSYDFVKNEVKLNHSTRNCPDDQAPVTMEY